MVTSTLNRLLGFLALFLLSCSSTSSEWNSIRKARAAQAVEEGDAELRRVRRELQRIDLEIEEARAVERLKSAELQELRLKQDKDSRQLGEQLRILRALEEDLASSSARRTEIDAALADLVALEARFAERQALETELGAKLKSLESAVQELEKRVVAREAELTLRRQELEARFADLGPAIEQIQAAIDRAKALQTVPEKQAEKPGEKK